MAGLLVAVTGQLRYALFSAVMPFLAVGTWYEARRRAKSGAGRGARAYAAELDTLTADARREAVVERTRLEVLAPDVAEVLRRAGQPSTRLWERRPSDDDFLHLCAGVADLPWRPPLDSTWAGLEDDVVARLDALRVPAGPVDVDLSQGRVVGHRRGAVGGAGRRALAAAAGRRAPGPGRPHRRGVRRPGARGRVGVGQVAAPHPGAGQPDVALAGVLPRAERRAAAAAAGAAAVAGPPWSSSTAPCSPRGATHRRASCCRPAARRGAVRRRGPPASPCSARPATTRRCAPPASCWRPPATACPRPAPPS